MRSRSLVLVVALTVGAVLIAWLASRGEPSPTFDALETPFVETDAEQTPVAERQTARSATRILTPWVEVGIVPDPTIAPEPLAGRRAELSGRLAWRDDGRPLVDARIRLTPVLMDGVLPAIEPPLDRGEALFLPDEVSTDDEGRFTLVDVPRDRQLHLFVQHGEHTEFIHPLTRLPQRGERIELGNLLVERRGSVTGTLSAPSLRVDILGDPAFRPLPRSDEVLARESVLVSGLRKGAILNGRLVNDELVERFNALPIPHATADQEGSFTVRGALPGENWLAVHAFGFPARKIVVRAEATTDLGTVHVPRLRPIRVTTEPKADVEIIALLGSVSTAPRRTGDDGTVTIQIPEDAARELTFGVRVRPDHVWRLQRTRLRGSRYHLKLPRARDLEVTVTSTKSSLDPDDILVRTWPSSGLGRRFSPVPDSRSRFRIVGAGDRSHLVVLAPGHAPHVAYATDNSGAEVVLEPGVAATFRALDADGNPLAGVAVRARLPDPKGVAPPLPRVRRNRVTLGATDDDGTLHVEHLWTGASTYRFEHPEHGLAVVDWAPGEETTLTAVLRPRGTLRGVLSADGRELSASPWIVALEERMKTPGTARSSLEVVAGADGRFEFADVTPGRYEVHAREAEFGRDGDLAFSRRKGKLVDLEPGEIEHIDVSVDHETRNFAPLLTGRIRQNGIDAPGLLLSLRNPAPDLPPAIRKKLADVGHLLRALERDGAPRARTNVFGAFEIYSARADHPIRDAVLEIFGRSDGRPTLLATIPLEDAKRSAPLQVDLSVGSIEVGVGTEYAQRMFRLRPTATGGIHPEFLVAANRFGSLLADGVPAIEYDVVAVDLGSDPRRRSVETVFGPITVPRADVLVTDVVGTRRTQLGPAKAGK